MNKEQINQKELEEIWQKEISHHFSMKKTYPDYPVLPRILLKNPKLKLSKINGHLESCLRGFNKRLSNWQKSYEIRIQNNI